MEFNRLTVQADRRVKQSGASPIASDFDLTLAETKYFWSWFIFGSIMTVETRHHLWRSWGFCTRHTWAHAAVECEVWGGRPFGTAILYEDLIDRAAAAAKTSLLFGGASHRRLRAKASCLACDYMAIAHNFDDQFQADRCARINRRARIGTLLLEAEPLWRGRTCPLCLGGCGIVCRGHILAGAAKPGRDLSDKLRELKHRLSLYVKSMTWQGPKATEQAKVSWIEALGWFAGWDFPVAVVAEARAESPQREGCVKL
jgi:hypothetical protein